MRRHLSNYFKGLPDFKPTRLQLVTLTDANEINATLDYIAQEWGGADLWRGIRRRCRTEYSACLPLLRSGHCSG